MKQIIAAVMVILLFLSGCKSENALLQPGLALRENLLNGKGCRFQAEIKADFGDITSSFSLDCRVDNNGDLSFEVLSPESISGISGSVDQQSGKLTFEETVLTFPLLAEGEVSPVSAPWLFYKALTGGYLRTSGKDGNQIRLTVDDSFQGENLTLDIWLEEGLPVCAEIQWQGRNILSLWISDFEIL